MKHPNVLLWLAAVLWLPSTPQAAAHDTDAAAENPEETTPAPAAEAETLLITASKIEEQPREVTQSVRLLEQRAWEQYATLPTNVSLILAAEPGQFVSVLSRNDANWGSIGGLGPAYSSYLLDGLTLDAFVDGMALDLWAIERVEQQRGPASVMYGGFLGMDFAGGQSPLAGVTHLVTRGWVDRPKTRLLVGGGRWGTAHLRGYHQDRAGNLHLVLGTSYERADYTDYGTEDSWLNILNPPRYEKFRLYGRTSYFFDRRDHRLSLLWHHASHSGQVGRPNRDYDHGYNLLNLEYSNQLSDAIGVQARLGLRLYERRWGEDNYPDLTLRQHDGVEQKILPYDLTLHWRHLEKSTLVAGTEGQLAWYQTYGEPGGLRAIGNEARNFGQGIYLEEKLILGDWVLRAGGRYQYLRSDYTLIGGQTPGLAEQSWQKLLWSAGVRFNGLEPLSLYANAGSGFLPPSAKSVGGTLKPEDRGVAGRNGQLPNPDLKPQSGMGFDAGIDARPLLGLRLSLRGFLYLVDDVIVENVVSQNPSQTQSVNAGDMLAAGGELAADYAWSRWLDAFANLTYIHSRIGNSLDPDQDGARTPFVPDYMANLGVSVHLPGQIDLSPRLQLAGTFTDSSSKSGHRDFGPYLTVSARVSKTFALPAAELVLAVDLDNLTDNRYQMPWQFRNPGFYVLGSVELRL